MRVSTGERLGNYVILIVFAAFALTPIVAIILTALGPETPQDAATGDPLHLENFARAWEQGRFSEYMTNSVLIAALVVTSATVLSIMAGYAFGAFEFRGSQVLFYTFLIGIMIPTEAIVVPLFFDFQAVGLTNTIWAIALPQIAQSVAFGTFWMRAYFRGANRSIIEAARLDGAGHHRVLWQVLIPVARPAVVTLVLLTFMWTWNEFLIPLVMSPNAQLRTAPLGLALFQGQYTQGTVLLAAGAVLVALPMVVLYLFLQRHFIRGMLEGAVKD
ncbi:carbohydrate ABC transporter permease [Georgenia wutianyii]|uniref:Carbohydrate ABC transporter permease n=1 Tax=Georgenia wutianyii TaxID=2585135 RepID=A0ABX5VPS9_9MICO|nr:carbohydrate ABC transporter permease [Georgenia wutianyii]QDB79676.1 carbohydrate ABC transporter permease [Georgenia wutianyii]